MGRLFCLVLLLAASSGAQPQTGCAPAAAFSPCDLVFELADAEMKSHPNPYMTVKLHGEFRSPRHRTLRVPGFWDGAGLIIRFTPTEPGQWDYRISSNVASIEGKQGTVSADTSTNPGFIRPANVHHWANTASNTPHLWMGDTSYRFATMERPLFDAMLEARAAQKFNHIRGLVLGFGEEARKALPTPDAPSADYFRELDRRIVAMNRKGIAADLILAGDQNQLTELLPDRRQRERFLTYLVARYSPMNITWQGVREFENYKEGRELLKEIGGLLKSLDPYGHPRSTHTLATSSPLLADGWMDYIVYQSADDQLGAIERQLYTVPFVNTGFGYEDSGAGKSHPHHVDTGTFRKRLWNATINGQYPTFGNTGAYGGSNFPPSERFFQSPGAQLMTYWFDFFSKTRYWELEPHFDVDGGRALSLPGIEYIVYVEKPAGPVELLVERHGYDVAWFNPATGERIPQKDWKGERFVAEPPNRTQDWVLHVSREGKKEGMRSYKFESRQILMQEVEQSAQRIPFEIVEPSADELRAGADVKYAVKIKRETRGTRSMMYLWTGEVVAGAKGARVLGTGSEGVFQIPPDLIATGEAVLNLRVTAVNANGKAYSLDRVYRVRR